MKFAIVNKWFRRTEFTLNNITITTGRYAFANGKHQIVRPLTANAKFEHGGGRYLFNNTDGISTVEDWYWGELYPNLQKLGFQAFIN